MNLAKLFNFKYFIQNVKKSKMAIILFLSIVPIFTALTIITTSSSNSLLEFYELGLANIIFMYITPFVLSFSLFGYIYKKKSIDFIGSMPISRKSIFVTNTIGGIILLILSQLVTLIISIILSTFSDAIIFVPMLFDIFIYQTIAYIFVFTVSNLAMSTCGNLLTQIVVTLLILFIIPASVFYFDLCSDSYYNIVDEGYTLSSNNYGNFNTERNYTAPSMIFSGDYTFNAISIVKMIILSVIYIIIGFYLFKNKKMEYAGESFENKYIHLIVKGLTTIPFVMLLVVLVDSSEWEVISFLIVIIAVYYLIYDLITNKRNKIRVNFIAMLSMTLVLFSTYNIIYNVSSDIDLEVDLKDIKSIEVQQVGNNISGLSYNIKDKDLIEKIIYSELNNVVNKEKTRVDMLLILSNGSRKEFSSYMENDLLKELFKQDMLNNCSALEVGNNRIKLSKDEKKKLNKVLNNSIKENAIEILNNTLKNNYRYFLYGYAYNSNSHSIMKLKIPINVNEDVFNVITSLENNNTAEYIRKRGNNNYIYLRINISNDFNYYGECPKELKTYILSNKDKICDMNKEYSILEIAGNNYFTNDIENVANIIKNSDQYKKNNDYEIPDLYFNDGKEVNTEIYSTESI